MIQIFPPFFQALTSFDVISGPSDLKGHRLPRFRQEYWKEAKVSHLKGLELTPNRFGFSDHPTALYLHTSAKEVVILFTFQEPTPSRKTYDADKTTCRDIMSFGNAILWLSTLSYFIPKESIEETLSVILDMEMFVKYVCFQNIVPREDPQSTCDVIFIDMYNVHCSI